MMFGHLCSNHTSYVTWRRILTYVIFIFAWLIEFPSFFNSEQKSVVAGCLRTVSFEAGRTVSTKRSWTPAARQTHCPSTDWYECRWLAADWCTNCNLWLVGGNGAQLVENAHLRWPEAVARLLQGGNASDGRWGEGLLRICILFREFLSMS